MRQLAGTVRHIDGGLVMWQADSGAGLGPVRFDAFGIGLGVDGAEPSTVLAVVAAPDDRDSGATCFNDPEFLMRMVEADDGTAMTGPALVEDLERAATIHAVNMFHVGHLDEALLCLDLAHATALCGEMERARGKYLMAAATLDSLIERLVESDGGRSIADEIETMVASCPGIDPDLRITNAAAAVVDRHCDRLAELLDQLAAQHEAETGFASLDGTLGGGDSAPLPVGGEVLDLGLLPPRLIRFTGHDDNDLIFRLVDDQIVEASAVLRSALLADSTDTDGVFLVAADSFTGELISSAPCTVSGMHLSARLWLADATLSETHFLLVASTVPLSRVHADPVAVRAARIDRACRAAWTQHRRAVTLAALITSTDDGESFDRARDQMDMLTAESASLCAGALSALAGHRDESDPAADTIYRRYIEGVQRLATAVSTHNGGEGPQRATLAELCAEAGW